MSKKRTNSGSSDEKGRGIDLLFGGKPEAEADDDDASNLVIDASSDTSATEELTVQSPPAEPSLATPPPPAAALDHASTVASDTPQVDELGLPVAMEAPPADLELASMEATLPTPPAPPAELDLSDYDLMTPSAPADSSPSDLDLSSSDFADTDSAPSDLDLSGMDVSEPSTSDLDLSSSDFADTGSSAEAVPADLDLAGLGEPVPAPELGDTASPPGPEAVTIPDPSLDIPDSMGEGDLYGESAQDLADLGEDDLSGIDDDNDLSDLEDELGGLPDIAPPIVSPPVPEPVSPVIEPVPIEPIAPTVEPVSPASPTPEPVSPTIDPVVPTIDSTPPTSTDIFGPATPTPPPDPNLTLPRARVESVSGIVSEKIQVVEKDILPEDTKFSGGPVSGILTVADRAQVEQNELITQRVTRYIGRERREKLDKDIENLYEDVAEELSSHKEDSDFALRILSQAQDIIFEDARQYDEALYRVAIVRTMITRRRNLRKWSYTYGSAVFFYAVVWLAAFLAGFLFTEAINAALNTATAAQEIVGNNVDPTATIRAAWFSALAGGIGGVIGILYSLYWKVAMKQDFDRQYTMYYIVQPIMGFILGALMYFIIGAGFLVINFAAQPSNDATQTTSNVLSSQIVISLQIVSGWIAGFRMRFTLELVDKIVQRFSGKDDEHPSSDPVSVAPVEQMTPLNPYDQS